MYKVNTLPPPSASASASVPNCLPFGAEYIVYTRPSNPNTISSCFYIASITKDWLVFIMVTNLICI